MPYEFNNGIVKSIQQTTPNGTRIVKLYFPKNCDTNALYKEIKEWAKSINCDIGLLLKRNQSQSPFVVVSPTLEAEK